MNIYFLIILLIEILSFIRYLNLKLNIKKKKGFADSFFF